MMPKRFTVGLASSVIGALCLSTLLVASQSDTPVADAAKRGDADAVRTLLKQGADVNAAQGDGMTALHWAALNGEAELAQMLIYGGANLKATTRLEAFTPLLMAAKTGRAAVVDLLLKAGADPNAATASGTTPLMFAAASGNLDAVNTLLAQHADVNAKESARGETALDFAAAYGRAPVIRVLTAHGADVAVATKVVDLHPFVKEELERFARFQRGYTGGPPPRDAKKGAEAPAAGGAPAKEAVREANARPAVGGVPGRPAPPGPNPASRIPGVDRQYMYTELVGTMGGLTPLMIAARQGSQDSVQALLDAGADINQVGAGDHTSPLLIAVINGHYDLAKYLLDHGANPKLAADNGVAPLYAVLNCEWAPKSLYPQPRAYEQQKTSYLDLMSALLDKGADPNARITRKVWYSGYNFDLSGVDETGATPFWRAAYAADVQAMKLLVSRGADPNIPTLRTPGRPRTGDGQRDAKDVSGLPPVPVGGPGVPPLVAAAGVGYGEGFAANSHRHAPTGMLAAVKYLVEELHADVNARDHDGNTALHNAAARGDNAMVLYLVSKGADVMAVNREGKTVADMANGPVQRVNPFPETLALLEKLGAKNNHKCVSC
ncbi:MAG: ankyrin repeat domain-containing protein [Betaproteobacteria bacterium]